MELAPELAEERTIIKILAGSHIHGLNVAGSDRDEEAVVIEPIEYGAGLNKQWEMTIRESDTLDIKYVSLRQWCNLALKGNPNALLLLLAPEQNIIKYDARGSQLRDLKKYFLSKALIKAHLGYLINQRKRMLGIIGNGGHGRQRDDDAGYDTKFAMHMLRLGLQGFELGATGHLTLPLAEPDKEFLLDVRAGRYPLSEILARAKNYEAMLELLLKDSPLPEFPDRARVEDFVIRTYANVWSADRGALFYA